MDQTILNRQNNYPGQHIQQDLKEAETERQSGKELKDKKYGLYFLLFQGLVYLIAVLSFGFGNPTKLGKPYDSNQLVCGVDVGLEAYKYIYFANPQDAKHLQRTVCVKECPTSENEMETDESLELQCFPNLLISSCHNRPSIEDPEYSMLYYDSVPFINVCLPKKLTFFQNIMQALEESWIITFLSDISNGKLIILATITLCFLQNQIFYLLLIKFQQAAIWIISGISVFGLFLSGGLGMLYYFHESSFTDIPKVSKLTNEQAIGSTQAQESSAGVILISSVLFLLFGLYFLIDLIVSRKTYKTIGYKITIVNYFFDFSSQQRQQEADSPSRFREILILLMTCSISLLIFCFIWVLTATNLFSIGNAESGYYAFSTFRLSWTTFIMGFIHIIELILVTITILGSEMMLLIGKVVEVYQSAGVHRQKIDPVQEKSLLDILEIYFKNNLGTVIFGEILIFALMIPRFFVKIYVKLREKINKQYEYGDTVKKILSINDRAYLLAYLRNDDFLISCESQQIFDDKLKATTKVEHHGELFSVTYCFAVANLCVSLTYVLIITTQMSIGIHQPIHLLAISFIFSYFISLMFSTVFGATIDNLTILLFRDSTADGRTIGTFVRNTIRLMKETELNEQSQLHSQGSERE